MNKKIKFNKLIPELSVTDINKSLEFYKNIGFRVVYKREEDKLFFLELEGSQIMIQQNNNNLNVAVLEYPYGRGINLSIEVKDIEKIYKKVKEHKYKLFLDIETHSYKVEEKIYNDIEFIILDPDGYMLRFTN